MKIIIIADAFPPMRNSASVQLRDLSVELNKQGNTVTVLIPDHQIKSNYSIEYFGDVRVIRIKARRTKDVNYVARIFGEMLMPYIMLWRYRHSNLIYEVWEGIIWYSPSIFFGPLIKYLKNLCGCRSYLIIRDIFPEWILDMGIIKKGPLFYTLKIIAHYQYNFANVIGVQARGNIKYFHKWLSHGENRRIEVLENWLTEAHIVKSSISIINTSIADKKIFIYAGNMGIAQNPIIFLELANLFRERKDVGFLFVGRGSEKQGLQAYSEAKKLNNVLFYDEIDPDEMRGLFSQCHVGLVALDPMHKTHNIPGKFIAYMQSGLPILGVINEGNDLLKLVQENKVGEILTSHKVDDLGERADFVLNMLIDDPSCVLRCKNLADQLYSTENAAKKILEGLSA